MEPVTSIRRLGFRKWYERQLIDSHPTQSGIDSVPGPTAKAVAPLAVAWMRVKCRKCAAIWRMPE